MAIFRDIWNECAAFNEERPFEARDYLYASELGGSIYDIWHKMNGIKPTTPPNIRSLRKFNAGHTWEWLVKMVLYNAGVLESTQERVSYNGSLRVSGKIDFVVSPGQVRTDINLSDYPAFLAEVIHTIDPMSVERSILEIKSVSSMLFPKREIEPQRNHIYQAWTYAKKTNLPAYIVYISKDDCLLAEHRIDPNDKDIESEVIKFIDKVAMYYDDNIKPPLEPKIIFENGKFSKNYKVEYSSYLDHYGYESPEEYRKDIDSWVGRWNRVLKRIKEGKDMTADNKKAINEWQSWGFEV